VLVKREQANRYGSVEGLDDEELADPEELERQVFAEEWAPILALPERTTSMVGRLCADPGFSSRFRCVMTCRKAVLSRGKPSGKRSFERLAHGIVMPCSEDWRVENAAGFIRVTVRLTATPTEAHPALCRRESGIVAGRRAEAPKCPV